MMRSPSLRLLPLAASPGQLDIAYGEAFGCNVVIDLPVLEGAVEHEIGVQVVGREALAEPRRIEQADMGFEVVETVVGPG